MADNGEWWRTIAEGEGGGGWRIRFGQRLPFKGVITHLTQKKEKKIHNKKRKGKASGASSPELVLSHIWLSCSLRWHERPQLSHPEPLFLPSLFALGELINWPRYQWLVVMVLIKEEIATL